ncbi:MAG: RES family NAD+ phosphorylase [Chitinophagaceae bacterium]|nr:RES family NAD+ phosphorylase [Chitinophagaceae bacterium]
MRHVYRIASSLHARDLSGGGAAKYGGRWNPKGTYVLYTASTASLAMLEWLAHARDRDMDTDYYLTTLELQDGPIFRPSHEDLPPTWMVTPPTASVQAYGGSFFNKGKWLGIEVPSVILPIETNIILDTTHPLFLQTKILSVSLIKPDTRLLPKQTRL